MIVDEEASTMSFTLHGSGPGIDNILKIPEVTGTLFIAFMFLNINIDGI